MGGWTTKREAPAVVPFTAQLPWALVLIGVGVVIGLFVVSMLTLTVQAPDDRGQSIIRPPLTQSEQPQEPNLGPFPGATSTPGPTTAAPSVSAAPDPSAAAEPDITGRYTVIDSNGKSFIGQVLITNTSTRPQGWTVQLRFPSDVGNLDAFWIEGGEQPSMRRSGSLLIFDSRVPAVGRSSVKLRFDFDRTGPNNNPTTCVTNGGTCAIG